MSKMLELSAKRLEDIRAKWRTDTGDVEMVEMYLSMGRTPKGYTDDQAGRTARILDLNGRLTSAQVANIRNALLTLAKETPLTDPEEKTKRKYTRRLSS